MPIFVCVCVCIYRKQLQWEILNGDQVSNIDWTFKTNHSGGCSGCKCNCELQLRGIKVLGLISTIIARVVDMQSQRDCIPLVEIMKIVALSNNQRICAAMMEVAIQRTGHPEIKVQSVSWKEWLSVLLNNQTTWMLHFKKKPATKEWLENVFLHFFWLFLTF